MNCAVGALLFGSLDFLMVILLWTRTVQVQEISQKSTRPKWPRVYRLDNGSYSTIQPPPYPTYVMKIEVWPALFGILLFLSQKLIRTTQQNSHQTCKKLNVPHVIRFSSPVPNSNVVLTNINVT